MIVLIHMYKAFYSSQIKQQVKHLGDKTELRKMAWRYQRGHRKP